MHFFGLGQKKKDELRFRIEERGELSLNELGALRTRLLAALHEDDDCFAEASADREAASDGEAAVSGESRLREAFLLQTACRKTMRIALQKNGGALPASDWLRVVGKDCPVQLPALQRLMLFVDENFARISEDGLSLVVPDILLATLTPTELLSLELCPKADIRLWLRRSDRPGAEGLRLESTFVRNGRQLFASHRDGILLLGARTSDLLPPALFMAADAAETFNAAEAAAKTQNERDLAWAKASAVLQATGIPSLEEAGGRARLVTASQLSISLDPKTGTITPALIAPEYVAPGEERRYRPLLTERQRKQFNFLADGRSALPDCFPLGNGTFLFLTDEARAVLQVIVKKCRGTPLERARFAANPRRAILEELEGKPGLSDADAVLNRVFFETPDFLSERVSAFGPWLPKHCAFAQPIKVQWFQDDEERYVIVIEGTPTAATLDEVQALCQSIEKAKAQGRDTVEFQGQTYELSAIDEASLKAFMKAVKEQESVQPQQHEAADENAAHDASEERTKPKELRYGPCISDNLEALTYSAGLQPERSAAPSIPALENGMTLYPHQKEALAWLQDLWRRGVPGGLLADDMGLGKTIQSLCFLKWAADAATDDDAAPSLIVAPLGLLENWKHEAAKYFGLNFPKPLVVIGREARELQQKSAVDRSERLLREAWVLTSYETLRDKSEIFGGIRWRIVIFDEAQKIKNPQSLASEAARALKQDFVLALTGTPVENSFVDLWSIMDAVVPGFMGSLKDFNARYCQADDPIAAGRELHQLLSGAWEPASRSGGQAPAGEAPVRLMLRRLKTNRLEGLPKKTVVVEPVPMPPVQRQAYSAVKRERLAGSGLNLVYRLSSCSLSPVPICSDTLMDGDFAAQSGRLTSLFRTLDRIHEAGEKVVIFVNRLELQQALARSIMRRYGMSWLPGTISGSMSAQARQRVVDEFQSRPKGFDALVLMIRSASTGITLTAASHVIHLERWWNPAVEDQASDRIYRIGQLAPEVFIHIPQSVFTTAPDDRSFDALLNGFLEQKRRLSQSVLLPQDNQKAEDGFIKSVLQGAGFAES